MDYFLQLCCFPECHSVYHSVRRYSVISLDRVQWRWCNRRKENRKGVVQHCLSARWRHSRAGVTLLFWSGKIWGSVSSCFSVRFIAPASVVELRTLHRVQSPDELTLPASTINTAVTLTGHAMFNLFLWPKEWYYVWPVSCVKMMQCLAWSFLVLNSQVAQNGELTLQLTWGRLFFSAFII